MIQTQEQLLEKPYECPVCFTKYYKEEGYIKHKCDRKIIAMKRKFLGGI